MNEVTKRERSTVDRRKRKTLKGTDEKAKAKLAVRFRKKRRRQDYKPWSYLWAYTGAVGHARRCHGVWAHGRADDGKGRAEAIHR